MIDYMLDFGIEKRGGNEVRREGVKQGRSEGVKRGSLKFQVGSFKFQV